MTRERFLLYLCFIVLFSFIITLIFILVDRVISYDKECMERIAKNVCQERNTTYDSFYYYGANCLNDVRSTDFIEMEFTEEEKESCKK